MKMGHESELKRRKEKHLPPEKLLRILCGIYPEDVAVQVFEELTGIRLSKEESDANNNS